MDDDLTPLPRDAEDRLEAVLHDRAETSTAAPISLDAVRDRARGIRRRRQAAVGVVAAAAAAVVAVAVPTVLSQPQGAVLPANPAPTAATALPTPIEVTQQAETGTVKAGPTYALTVDALPTGAQPQVLHVVGHEIVTANGTRIQVSSTYLEVAPFRTSGTGGYLAVRPDAENGYACDHLDPQGGGQETWPCENGLAMSADQRWVAWLEGAQLVVHDNQRGTTNRLGVDLQTGSASLVGVLPDGRVVLNDNESAQQARVVGPGGPAPVDGILKAFGVSGSGEVAGTEKVNPDASACSQVVDANGDQVLSSCLYTPQVFSPDGALVAAGSSYLDGESSREAAILTTADGGAVQARWLSREQGDPEIFHMSWEDETHLLLTVRAGGSWYVLRADGTGHLEVADSSDVPSDDPFAFMPSR